VFPIALSDLASYDSKTASWIAEAGKYTVKVGSSSTNFKSTASFLLGKDVVTEKDKNLLIPQVDITELKK
jgi:beta-glucosidase